jgi:hypothetical protein
MKIGFFIAIALFLCLCALIIAQEPGTAFADNSGLKPVEVVLAASQISDQLVRYANSLVEAGYDPDDENLVAVAFAMFDSCFYGKALYDARRRIYVGLANNWHLANTDCFDWAFALPLLRKKDLKVISADDSTITFEFYKKFFWGPKSFDDGATSEYPPQYPSKFSVTLNKVQGSWKIIEIIGFDSEPEFVGY